MIQEPKPQLLPGGGDLITDVNNDGYIIGARGQLLLKYSTVQHLITMAPTGGGKGRSVVIPNLLTHQGSLFTIEIVGDNLKSTYKWRKHFLKQNIYVIDPLEITPYDEERASYNFLASLKPDSPEFITEIELICRTIIENNDSNAPQDPYWIAAPTKLLIALIIYVVTEPELEHHQRNIPYICELLASFGEDSAQWNNLMLQFVHDQGKYQRYLNDIGSSFFGVFNDNVRSVVDVLKSNLKWAYDPQLAKYISSSSFSFRELRERKSSIYIVMPTTEVYEAKKTFLRLLVEAAIRECPPLTNEQKVNLSWGDRILFMLDEFTQLGKLEAINTGMQTCRHKGITLWCVFQDWNRLVKLYGEETEGIGGSESNSQGGSYSVNYTPQIIPKLDEAQLRELLSPSNNAQILILNDGRTIIDGKANWDKIESLNTRVNGPNIPKIPEFQLSFEPQFVPPFNSTIYSFEEHLLILEEIEQNTIEPNWQEIPSILSLGMEINNLILNRTSYHSFQEIVNLTAEVQQKIIELENRNNIANLSQSSRYKKLKNNLKYLQNCQVYLLNDWSEMVINTFQNLIPAAQKYLENIKLYAQIILQIERIIEDFTSLVGSRFAQINDHQQFLQQECYQLMSDCEGKLDNINLELNIYYDQLVDYLEKRKVWPEIPALTLPEISLTNETEFSSDYEKLWRKITEKIIQLKVYYGLELPVFKPSLIPEFPDIPTEQFWTDFFTFFEQIEAFTAQQNALHEESNQIIENLPSQWNLWRREQRLQRFNHLQVNHQNQHITMANYYQILSYYPLVEQQISLFFNNWLSLLLIGYQVFEYLQQRKQNLISFQAILLGKLNDLDIQSHNLNLISQAMLELEKLYYREYQQQLQEIQTWNFWQ